jgi:hypothetical protein
VHYPAMPIIHHSGLPKLGWAAGVCFGIAVLTWWLMRRRWKRKKSSSVRDHEFCYPDGQEKGVVDCSDGKE